MIQHIKRLLIIAFVFNALLWMFLFISHNFYELFVIPLAGLSIFFINCFLIYVLKHAKHINIIGLRGISYKLAVCALFCQIILAISLLMLR